MPVGKSHPLSPKADIKEGEKRQKICLMGVGISVFGYDARLKAGAVDVQGRSGFQRDLWL